MCCALVLELGVLISEVPEVTEESDTEVKSIELEVTFRSSVTECDGGDRITSGEI